MKTWISFYIGKFSKRYRMWYWKTHNNSYMWGLFRFMNDVSKQDVEPNDAFNFIKQNISRYENE